NRRVEVAILPMLLESRERQVVPQADVHGQLLAELDIVLEIPGVVPENEINVRAEAEIRAVGEAQQERRIIDAGVGHRGIRRRSVAGGNDARATVAVYAAV